MSQMLNVRVEPDLAAAIESAATAAGVSRSVWMREVLAASANANGEAHPPRALALQASREIGHLHPDRQECRHPKTARRKLPFSEVCGICGTTTRQL